MLSNLKPLPSVWANEVEVRIEVDPLSATTEAIAAKELRESPERKVKAVEALRALLKEETDLYAPIDNDLWLIMFLRPTKYYPESARNLIKQYYSFKVKHANTYNGLLPSTEPNIFHQNILTVMLERDQFGRRVLLLEMGKRWKHKECTLDDIFKGCVLLMEAAMLEPQTQVCGLVVIFDMDDLSLQQALQFTPFSAKRMVDFLQDAIPMRIKNMHIINQPKIFNVVFALVKPFLREKLRGRVIFHGTDRDSLHKYISPQLMPAQYGGSSTATRVDGMHWHELLVRCEPEYVALKQFGMKPKH